MKAGEVVRIRMTKAAAEDGIEVGFRAYLWTIWEVQIQTGSRWQWLTRYGNRMDAFDACRRLRKENPNRTWRVVKVTRYRVQR